MVRLASYRKKEALKGRVVFTSPTKRPHPLYVHFKLATNRDVRVLECIERSF